MARGDQWSAAEVEAIVADYMHMLTLELAGQTYNKSAHRRMLGAKLDGRPDASIERKHQNISAVLMELGCPWISGYKPLPNYQGALFNAVSTWLSKNTSEFDKVALAAAEQPAATPLVTDYSTLLVDAPKSIVLEQPRATYTFERGGGKRDYVAREARNVSLGLAGEELVLAYERFQLRRMGRDSLADRVEHVSRSRGDGEGFDILSFDSSGEERFIEVKTTAFGKQTPFYASRNEIEFARTFSSQFFLYRIFEFRRAPRLFELRGKLEQHCFLDPVSYLCCL